MYAGRSGVVSPSGEWMVQAPSDRAGVVSYTLDLDAATGAPVVRRPELYSAAALPAEQSRAAELARTVTGAKSAHVFDHVVRKREAGPATFGRGASGVLDFRSRRA